MNLIENQFFYEYEMIENYLPNDHKFILKK